MIPNALGDITNSPAKTQSANSKKHDALLPTPNQPHFGDFQKDITKTVARCVTIPGRIAHAFALTGSPVPALSVEEFHDIDLPFQALDAKAFISRASHRTEKSGVHYWEAEHVHFSDQKWYSQLESALFPSATDVLGVSTDAHGPFEIDLDRFLITTPGCRIERTSTTDRADDSCFAVVLVLLPYEQPPDDASSLPSTLRVSSGAQSIAYDLQPCLPSSTLALCWYSDVNYMIQLGGGYRAGLLYNITCASTDPPRFSDVTAAFKRLGEILEKWSGPTPYGDKSKLVVLPLSEKNTEKPLTSGHACLSGCDRVLATYLYGVSKQYNFQFALGSLSSPNSTSSTPRKRKHEPDAVAVLENVVSWMGSSVMRQPLYLDATEIASSNESLEQDLPSNAIVLILNKYETFVMLRSDGIEYAVEKLHKMDTSRPSTEATFLVNLLAHNAAMLPLCGNLLRALAIKWSDPTAWYATINFSDSHASERLLDALVYFGFESLKAIFKDYITKANLSSSFYFLHVLPQRVLALESQVVSIWAKENTMAMLRAPRIPVLQDVPAVLQIAEFYGYGFVQTELAPSMKDSPGSFTFWMYLFRLLLANGPVTTNSEGQQTHIQEFDSFCEYCLHSAARVTRVVDAIQSITMMVQEEVINRAIEFMIECADRRYSAMFPVIMRNLLPSASSQPSEIFVEYKNLYIPLVPHVFQFLSRVRWDPFTGTFGAWFRHLINIYMTKVLGPAPEFVEAPLLGCDKDEDCLALDHFLKRWDLRETTFHIPNARRKHLIVTMQQVSEFLIWETHKVGLPHQLQVTKAPYFVDYQAWCQRRLVAGDFFRILGYHFLVQLLGEETLHKYTTILEIDGCFLWTEGQLEAPLPRLPIAGPLPLASPFSLSNCLSSSIGQEQAQTNLQVQNDTPLP